MSKELSKEGMTTEQEQSISEAVEWEQGRLRSFIRKRVPDRADAEDILQEVFYELVEAYRMMKPIEQVGAWLFRVARNRITDFFRNKKPEAWTNDSMAIAEDGEDLPLEDLLPSPDAGFSRKNRSGSLTEFVNAPFWTGRSNTPKLLRPSTAMGFTFFWTTGRSPTLTRGCVSRHRASSPS